MGKVLVTGCAGFIGSHLCERLLNAGETVVGVDCFTQNYDRWLKQRNLSRLLANPRFTFLEMDLLRADLPALLDGVSVVYHQAAFPGVRTSWGRQFRDYMDNNVLLTQQLLEAVKTSQVQKMVYASSSSVYGGMDGPTCEDAALRPFSPYGVTKLSAEQLCQLYALNFGVPVISLRYFTVFGPRQRPDMAIHRFVRAVMLNGPITVFGDGEQTRDFTYVDDIVTANLLAADAPVSGEVFNIGGGCRASVLQLIRMIEHFVGKRANVTFRPAQAGDPRHTWADCQKAREQLRYVPQYELAAGLEREVEGLKQLYQP